MTLFWSPFGLKPHRADGDGVRYADIYARAVAAGIDLVLLFFMLNEPFRLLAVRLYEHVDRSVLDKVQGAGNHLEGLLLIWQSQLPQWWLVNTLVQLVVLGVAIVGCQCIWFTTPGKWLLGLQIVDAKTLEIPSRGRFLLRYVAYIPALLPAMIGIFWISFNRQRRGWHDYIARTAVIHTRPRNWTWLQMKRAFTCLRRKCA